MVKWAVLGRLVAEGRVEVAGGCRSHIAGDRSGFGVRIQGFNCPLFHRESQVELREHIDSLATGEPNPGGHPCPPHP